MSYELVDIPKVGGSNAPGMSEQILVCDKKEILAFPAVIDPVVNPGDSLRLDGDITFDTGDGFVEIYATKDTVQLMLKKVGQKDSRGFELELPFFHPSSNPAFAELLLEDPDLVILVKKPDCEGTEYICVGTSCRGVEIHGDFDSGLSNEAEGRHGFSATISGYVPKYHYYTGTVTMKP